MARAVVDLIEHCEDSIFIKQPPEFFTLMMHALISGGDTNRA